MISGWLSVVIFKDGYRRCIYILSKMRFPPACIQDPAFMWDPAYIWIFTVITTDDNTVINGVFIFQLALKAQISLSLSPFPSSLSFSLWIPQVRGQPLGLFFSRINPQRPLVWGSGWWDLAMRWCLSMSSSAFPDSDVHTLQLWGYVWHSGSLNVSVPSQSWLT